MKDTKLIIIPDRSANKKFPLACCQKALNPLVNNVLKSDPFTLLMVDISSSA